MQGTPPCLARRGARPWPRGAPRAARRAITSECQSVKRVWRNGSASDSRSDGLVLESLCARIRRFSTDVVNWVPPLDWRWAGAQWTSPCLVHMFSRAEVHVLSEGHFFHRGVVNLAPDARGPGFNSRCSALNFAVSSDNTAVLWGLVV